jgi:hypothetical protein
MIIFLRSVRRLLVTANVVASSPILVTLMAEALGSSETSVLTRSTRRNILEDGILHVFVSSLFRFKTRKLRITTLRDPPRRPRDTPLSTKVDTTVRRQMGVAQSVLFVWGLRVTEFVCLFCFLGLSNSQTQCVFVHVGCYLECRSLPK